MHCKAMGVILLGEDRISTLMSLQILSQTVQMTHGAPSAQNHSMTALVIQRGAMQTLQQAEGDCKQACLSNAVSRVEPVGGQQHSCPCLHPVTASRSPLQSVGRRAPGMRAQFRVLLALELQQRHAEAQSIQRQQNLHCVACSLTDHWLHAE